MFSDNYKDAESIFGYSFFTRVLKIAHKVSSAFSCPRFARWACNVSVTIFIQHQKLHIRSWYRKNHFFSSKTIFSSRDSFFHQSHLYNLKINTGPQLWYDNNNTSFSSSLFNYLSFLPHRKKKEAAPPKKLPAVPESVLKRRKRRDTAKAARVQVSIKV